MSDERIEKYGIYFVYFDILERFGISFEKFIQLCENDMWEEYVS